MKCSSVLVAGASGFIGSFLVPFLRAEGHQVTELQRQDPDKPFFWDPANNVLKGSLEGFDWVINLAGYSVISGMWSEGRKKKIRDSRILSTRALVQAMQKQKVPPKVFLSASATGFYGHSADMAVDETHPAGSGFLASVCKEWEHEANQAQKLGVRVVTPRIGIVLDKEGGALAKMLPAFKLGLVGRVGSGAQWMSWIGMQDLLSLIQFCLLTESVVGAVNAVSPNPVTNKEFTKSLAHVLHRPSFCSVPEWLLRLSLGELAQETFLASCKAYPSKLQEAGFQFRYPSLEMLLSFLFTR